MIILSIITAILAIYSIVATVALSRTIFSLEKLETYYEDTIVEIEARLAAVTIRVQDTVARLKEVDIRGSFEADDEVGFAFKEIKQINEELLDFIIELNKTEDDAEESKPE